MNNKQLTFAREYRGYTQTELAGNINGLSQSNLSKFEKGFGILSDSVQDRIIEFLDFPKDFFQRKISNKIENANYRKRTTPKYLVDAFESRCKVIGYVVDRFAEDIDWPDFDLVALDVESGHSPENVAKYTRRLLQISDDEPIRDIFTLLESHGIIFYELDTNDKFDGVSFITDQGYPVIVLNINMANDRKRFTIAHELAHLLMHNENHFPVSDYRDKEKEANDFASEFLMPASAIRNSLLGLKMNYLSSLKQYWLTSMSSIIRRARNLKCIDEKRYKNFMIEFSRNGFNKKEPISVPIDSPDLIILGKELLENELGYSRFDFMQALSLPFDIIDEILPQRNDRGKVISLKKAL